MLYLIGGSPRAGKTLMANHLLKHENAAPIHVDAFVSFVEGLSKQFPDELPPRWLDGFGVGFEKEFQERAENLLEQTIAIAKDSLMVHGSATIEGDTILPRHVEKFEAEIGASQLRTCFLGLENPDIESILTNEGHDPWFKKLDNATHPQYVEWFKERTRIIKEQCSVFGQSYVDMTSSSWNEQFNLAVKLLVP